MLRRPHGPGMGEILTPPRAERDGSGAKEQGCPVATGSLEGKGAKGKPAGGSRAKPAPDAGEEGRREELLP